MLRPKGSHLVERVAERLLRSGDLKDSAAQLLRTPQGPSMGDDADQPAIPTDLQADNTLPKRSSLFTRPPVPPAPLLPPSSHKAATPSPQAFAAVDDDSNALAIGSGGFGSADAPNTRQEALPPQPSSNADQRQMMRQSGVTDHPATLPPTMASHDQKEISADPAPRMLQGSASIDMLSLERAGMIDWSHTRTRISEEFRLVQRQIIRTAFGPGAEPGFSNLLLVTSATPGEGKSFMATNLAGSIARQGDHHVLLVDADSKRDSVCYSLGLAQAQGLLDLVANPQLDVGPLIVRTPIERLSILPVGRERARSAELFSTKEMTRLIQNLGRRYADRLLILDAPPCLSTSDPAVLAQVVGQILFVVEAERTQRAEIEASLDLIQACPTITLVLNKQQISSRYTFGAYSSYYAS